jgi:hypothetical protein
LKLLIPIIRTPYDFTKLLAFLVVKTEKKMGRCGDGKMWRWEDVEMWRWEDVEIGRCEDWEMWGEKFNIMFSITGFCFELIP